MKNGNGNDRPDRIERILEESAKRHAEFEEQTAQRHREFAARQQYHDEAFERFDTRMKQIMEATSVATQNRP